MDELTAQNKRAWEYRAYEHWNRLATPAEKAQELIRDRRRSAFTNRNSTTCGAFPLPTSVAPTAGGP